MRKISGFFLVFLTLIPIMSGQKSIKILYPNGGEILYSDSQVIIRWEAIDVKGKLVISLYKKGIMYSTVSKEAENTGTFLWNIPDDIAEGDDYRIRIRSLLDLYINDFSDRNFSIKKKNTSN